MAIIKQQPQTLLRISQAYYSFLSALLAHAADLKLDGSLILTAIRVPLVWQDFTDTGGELSGILIVFFASNSTNTLSAPIPLRGQIIIDAHAAFALHFLTTPNLVSLLGSLNELAAVVHIEPLSSALIQVFAAAPVQHVEQEGKLWLLAHFISLHRLQFGSDQEPEYLRALSLQLSDSSADIVGRIDLEDFEVLQQAVDNVEDDKTMIQPLPTFIKKELLSLVDQASISGLLAKFNIDYAKASHGEEDASLLASYALTLLRMFPRRGDEIRMWLHRGSLVTAQGVEVPSLKFFWQAMKLTNTFSAITTDSKAALTLLRPQTQRVSISVPSSDTFRDWEWRTILLFLELYTFVLRFTDDEEFLSASKPNLDQVDGPISRFGESALPLEDVKLLTIFLKNLAFTTYFNASDLFNSGQQPHEGGLGSYFLNNTSSSVFRSSETEIVVKALPVRPFAGIAGMTFDYVQTIVTGVMRMLYQRDSRRRFLPKGHWLMTSRFDMEGFITAVVAEEERQHEKPEGEDDDPDADDDTPLSRNSGLIGMARPRRALQIEMMRRQQQKAARQKVLQAVGPRLKVLQNMPFVIPFETRVQIFRQFVFLDQTRRRGGNVDPDIWRMSIMQQAHGSGRTSANELLGRHHAKISRERIFETAFEQFYGLGDGLKEPIQITFVDKFDTVEAGIDGGGVTKEFLTSITNEAFRAEDGPNLFIANDQNLLYPNPAILDMRKEVLREAGIKEGSAVWQESLSELLKYYEFLGRIVGKCLYEGILVDIGFAGFFLLKWASPGDSGYRTTINDLREFDESLYQGLMKLKNYQGNVEELGIDFTIIDTISSPGEPTKTVTRDLMPNGANITVTNKNRPLYFACVARHRLQDQPKYQTQAFLKGLSDIINPSWLSMFNQSELQTLIGGDSSEIDVDDLRNNTLYGGVYQIGDDGMEHPTVRLFWRVMKSLDDSDRRKVLKYVTSTPRAPLLGFSQLNPRFSIRDAGSDEERLPSTSTCVNLLKLPRYSTEKVLRQKLLYAVNSGAGFDLS